jgi:hypothetical protein
MAIPVDPLPGSSRVEGSGAGAVLLNYQTQIYEFNKKYQD